MAAEALGVEEGSFAYSQKIQHHKLLALPCASDYCPLQLRMWNNPTLALAQCKVDMAVASIAKAGSTHKQTRLLIDERVRWLTASLPNLP